ncbi:MAG: tetratricopeptide repeat protein [Rikenellaceae bacterium]
MAKKNVETSELETLGTEAMSKTEHFFEENGQKIVMAIVAIVAVAVAIFGYNALVVEPKEDRAADMIYAAQAIFESGAPDFQLALEGDASTIGLLEVIENYSSTKSGNLAYHYAGICYLKLGDLNNAQRYLAKYKAQKGAPAMIVNAQNIGLQGDIAVDQSNYAAAVELFTKAANNYKNDLTTPIFLRKAGMAAQAAGNKAQAKELFESVVDLYPNSQESATAAKLLNAIK